MDGNAVLLKTDKGLGELKTRAHGLPQKLRTLLIMLDGKTTVDDLLARFPGLDDLASNLRSLVDQGFATVSGAPAAGSVAPAVARAAAPAVASAAAPAPGKTRQQALSELTRYVYDAVGPPADLVTAALERARTPSEFAAATDQCAAMIEGMGSARKAQAFRERAGAFVESFLPS